MLKALYEVCAPAKLNLFLHVVGRRPDGYHLIESVFVLIDWADTLHVELRNDGALVRRDLLEPLPADDLCLRAARALQRAAGVEAGAYISIEKRIPAGAGMGGGSSDAASTMLALNRLWRLGWPRSRLAQLALSIGADVPFFIGGRNAFVGGVGECLTPLDVPRASFAVVKPAASIATAALFGNASLTRDTPAIIESFLADTAFAGAALLEGWGRNDLQPPAQAVCPEVAQAARWLRERFGNSRMTGSGSAVFARLGTGDASEATRGTEGLLHRLPAGWAGRVCRSLDRHPLADWCTD